MAQSLQGPGSQNNPDGLTGDLASRLKALSDRIAELERGAQLRSAGITVSPAGMTVNSSLDVDGTLNVAGDAVFSGDLSVPNGSIKNAFLESPVVTDRGFSDADGFGLTTTRTTLASFSVTVPAGYTQALVIADGVIFALNPTASVDYLYARVYIDSPVLNTWGRELLSMMGPNNGSAALAVNKQARLTGLTGGQVITCRLTGYTAFAPMSAAANGTSINAVLIFTR